MPDFRIHIRQEGVTIGRETKSATFQKVLLRLLLGLQVLNQVTLTQTSLWNLSSKLILNVSYYITIYSFTTVFCKTCDWDFKMVASEVYALHAKCEIAGAGARLGEEELKEQKEVTDMKGSP